MLDGPALPCYIWCSNHREFPTGGSKGGAMDIGFGIDGGGTRTRLILFETGSLRPLYQGEGGPSNPHSAASTAPVSDPGV